MMRTRKSLDSCSITTQKATCCAQDWHEAIEEHSLCLDAKPVLIHVKMMGDYVYGEWALVTLCLQERVSVSAYFKTKASVLFYNEW